MKINPLVLQAVEEALAGGVVPALPLRLIDAVMPHSASLDLLAWLAY